jgi:hypothetical protein
VFSVNQEDKMPRLHIVRGKVEKSTGRFGRGKKTFYTLSLTVELSQEERYLLEKYGKLNEKFFPQPADDIVVIKQMDDEAWEGPSPAYTTVADLQNGVEWACTFLPDFLGQTPLVVKSEITRLLREANAREEWAGEDVVDFP